MVPPTAGCAVIIWNYSFFPPVFSGYLESEFLLFPCPMTDPKTKRFQIAFLCSLVREWLKCHMSTPLLHPNFPLVEYLPCHEYFERFLFCTRGAVSQLSTCNYSSPSSIFNWQFSFQAACTADKDQAFWPFVNLLSEIGFPWSHFLCIRGEICMQRGSGHLSLFVANLLLVLLF